MPINFPEVRKYSHLELLARQVVEGFITGLHKSPFHGFSVEFAEHRLYNTGESTRHIDWKLYARTDRLFVKKYEEETNLRCFILIDNSSSMHYPSMKLRSQRLNKIEFSVHAAAAIIYMLRSQRDAVGLGVFSSGIEQLTPAKSSSVHHKFLFSTLEKLIDEVPPVHSTTDVTTALHQFADIIHKRSLIILFSDMMDSNEENKARLFSALQHFRHNKHEVLLFHVTDKKSEQEFSFDNRPYLFVDVETGEQIKVHANEVKEHYKTRYAYFKKELTKRCAQYQVDFIEADIASGYNQVLLPYLIKRQRLK